MSWPVILNRLAGPPRQLHIRRDHSGGCAERHVEPHVLCQAQEPAGRAPCHRWPGADIRRLRSQAAHPKRPPGVPRDTLPGAHGSPQ